MTPKAQDLNRKFRQVVLEVHPQATKPMIARALKAVFNADAERINTVSGESKARRQAKGRGRLISGKAYKRAIVTLKQGADSGVMDLVSAVPHNISSPETAE